MGLVDFEVIENHIGLVTLNRPEAANAMSKALLDELNQVVNTIDHDHSIYCVIITGNGEKAFCAGADLKERKGMNNDQVIEAVKYIGSTVSNVEALQVPVIAAINGVAFGGGLELALACDIRLATNTAKMGLTETSLAIIPGAGGTQRLPRLIGVGQAKRLIYSAQPIDAEESNRIGLIEYVTDNDVTEAAINLATKIASNGPIALKAAKQAINSGTQVELNAGLKIEHECYKETIPTRDRSEGLAAFQEKRKPSYLGK